MYERNCDAPSLQQEEGISNELLINANDLTRLQSPIQSFFPALKVWADLVLTQELRRSH